jgi:hypothetical protein
VFCGEILLENGIGFHEVSYERRRWPEKWPVKSNKKLMNIESSSGGL